MRKHGQSVVYAEASGKDIAIVYDGDADADLIAAAPDMKKALEHFSEWHANHFGDFDAATNAQLVCLANETEAALQVTKGDR